MSLPIEATDLRANMKASIEKTTPLKAPEAKRPYHSPALATFGSIKALTSFSPDEMSKEKIDDYFVFGPDVRCKLLYSQIS